MELFQNARLLVCTVVRYNFPTAGLSYSLSVRVERESRSRFLVNALALMDVSLVTICFVLRTSAILYNSQHFLESFRHNLLLILNTEPPLFLMRVALSRL